MGVIPNVFFFIPQEREKEAVQRFFMQEVQLGEELLGQGDIESGVEHLSLAVAVCGQPQSLRSQLFENWQKTLPSQIFSQLMQKLDFAQKKFRSDVAAFMPDEKSLTISLSDSDVEDETKSVKDLVIERKAEDEKKMEPVQEKSSSMPEVEDETKSVKDLVIEKNAEAEKV